MSGEALARRFHEAYERLAPQHGYETRADTKAFDPESANGRLMIAVCAELTTQQDSVDVERLREAEAEVERLRAVLVRICEEDRYTTRRKTNLNGGLRGHAGMVAAFALTGKNGSYLTDADVREHVAALSLPITQRDEQGDRTYADGAQTERRAEAALAVAERLMQFTTHNIGCAVYRRSYASGLPTCTCGVDAAREAVTAIRRLSIEQGDQDGGAA